PDFSHVLFFGPYVAGEAKDDALHPFGRKPECWNRCDGVGTKALAVVEPEYLPVALTGRGRRLSYDLVNLLKENLALNMTWSYGMRVRNHQFQLWEFTFRHSGTSLFGA